MGVGKGATGFARGAPSVEMQKSKTSYEMKATRKGDILFVDVNLRIKKGTAEEISSRCPL
jgi:hypothetical protein